MRSRNPAVVESSVKWEVTKRVDSGSFEDDVALASALEDGWAPFAVTLRSDTSHPVIWLRRPAR